MEHDYKSDNEQCEVVKHRLPSFLEEGWCRKCDREEPYYYTKRDVETEYCGEDICPACVAIRKCLPMKTMMSQFFPTR